MSTITKEWLQKAINDYESVRDELPFGLDDYQGNILAALRIALASLEAEPVAYMYKDNLHSDARFSLHTRFGNWSQEDINEYEITEIPLYAAPPAPVSVPEPIKRNDADGWWMYKGRRVGGGCAEWYNRALDDCRAAMLQGADGDSPVIPDGWVVCSERMPGEVLAALQNVARLRRNLNDFCGDKSLIAKCLSEAEGALLNAVNRHSTMLAEPLNEAKNV